MRFFVLLLFVVFLFVSDAFAIVNLRYSALSFSALDTTDSSSIGRAVNDDMKIQVSQLDLDLNFYNGIGGYWSFSYGASDSIKPNNSMNDSNNPEYEALKLIIGLAPDNARVPALGVSQMSISSLYEFNPHNTNSNIFISEPAMVNDGDTLTIGDELLLTNKMTKYSVIWGVDGRKVGPSTQEILIKKKVTASFSLDLIQSEIDSFEVLKKNAYLQPVNAYLVTDTLYSFAGEFTFGVDFYEKNNVSLTAGSHGNIIVGDLMGISVGYFFKGVWDNIFNHGMLYLTVDGTILDTHEYMGTEGPNEPELIVPTYTNALFAKFYFGGGFYF